MNTTQKCIMKMKRGTVVIAVRCLDPVAANVIPGTKGVVFEETNFYGDDCGPMVRWMTGTCCNVYPGDVKILSR